MVICLCKNFCFHLAFKIFHSLHLFLNHANPKAGDRVKTYSALLSLKQAELNQEQMNSQSKGSTV